MRQVKENNKAIKSTQKYAAQVKSSIEKQEPLPKVMSYMEVETMVLHLIIFLSGRGMLLSELKK